MTNPRWRDFRERAKPRYHDGLKEDPDTICSNANDEIIIRCLLDYHDIRIKLCGDSLHKQ